MEWILVSAATGALKPVLGKLATLAGDEYKRLKGIRGEIESLSRELAAMDAFLEKMSEAEAEAEEEPDPRDKVWMNEVRELSYEVEDSIDDFMARVDARPDGFLGKIRGFVGRTKARHGIAKKIEELKKQIDEVSQTNARYRSGEPAASVSNKSKRHLSFSSSVTDPPPWMEPEPVPEDAPRQTPPRLGEPDPVGPPTPSPKEPPDVPMPPVSPDGGSNV